jgi:hypothetical protein
MREDPAGIGGSGTEGGRDGGGLAVEGVTGVWGI